MKESSVAGNRESSRIAATTTSYEVSTITSKSDKAKHVVTKGKSRPAKPQLNPSIKEVSQAKVTPKPPNYLNLLVMLMYLHHVFQEFDTELGRNMEIQIVSNLN